MMKVDRQSHGLAVQMRAAVLTAALALIAGAVSNAHAQAYSVLYSFQCTPDGAFPEAGLVEDNQGNLYGTTTGGGAFAIGSVFKVAQNGTETLLHSFAGSPQDGADPRTGSLILDRAGNVYGVTDPGGTFSAGTVFEVSQDGSESVLYSFPGGFYGYGPVGGLAQDSHGNLYGTTEAGGGWDAGVVFKLNLAGREMVLHDFNDIATDGAEPEDGLIRDEIGDFFGTTYYGGVNNAGTVFEISPGGTETLLYSFLGPPADGANPESGKLLRDAAGNLFGATYLGGLFNQGAIFKLTDAGVETILFSFPGGKFGAYPYDGLAEDGLGNLYGTTSYGGASSQCGATIGCGVLFELATTGKELVLHTFANDATDGGYPNGGLIHDSTGALYGTTTAGGAYGCGTVFKMKP
jgi:uncharacterized repeat protein (TIGR03803 family)